MSLPEGISKRYPLAKTRWQGSSTTVMDAGGMLICSIPHAFLESSGVDSLRLAIEIVRMCIHDEGILCTVDGASEILTTAQFLEHTKLMWKTALEVERPSYVMGPRFSKFRQAPDVEQGSTMSNSSRNTTNQYRFKVELAARDGTCLITDAEVSQCMAAHIVPQSRPEYYAEVLGEEPTDIFSDWCGLFLSRGCHNAWDEGQVAFYPSGGGYIVHWLFPDEDFKKFHGKVLTRERFRGPDYRLPNEGLLRFHYQQCVLKYFRGFDHGFARPSS